MKKIGIILTSVLLFSTVAHAQLMVVGSGSSMALDTSGFPPAMQEAYNLMTHKCTRCHTIERIIEAVQTGTCPISKTTFNRQTSESVVVRMYLKPEANMSRHDAKTVLDLLNFLLDERTRSVAEKRYQY